MNMSKRDINILIIVVSVLIGVLYYRFGYTSLVENRKESKQEEVVIETRYNKVMSDIQTLEDRKSKVTILSTKSMDKASSFYPQIIQQKLILEINKILEENSVKGNLNFSDIVVKEVEDTSPNAPLLPETSFDGIINKINDKVTEKAADNTVASSAPVTVAGVTCEQNGVVITIPDITMEVWNKLLASLSSYDRRIVCTSLKYNWKSETNASAELSIEFFGVPKLGDIDASYFNWDKNNVEPGSALGSVGTVIAESGEAKTDFVALLKPFSSEISTFRMGVAKDETLNSYIYADKNAMTDVILELTEKDGVFYYKYSADGQQMPQGGQAEGKKFIPSGDNIVFKIFSEARTEADDQSGIKLKVINNTTKVVDVILDKDDTTNPRVIVTAEGQTVNVK